MSFHKYLDGANLHNSKIIHYPGNPSGNVVASIVGEMVIDNVNNAIYTATDVGTNDWVIVGGSGDISTLSGLSDINTAAREDGYILEWDSASGNYVHTDRTTYAYTEKTANYTLLSTDFTVGVVCSNANLTMTLFSAAALPGKVVNIKKLDSTGYSVLITPQAGETIDGDPEKTIGFQWTTLTLQSTGTNWIIL